MSRFLSSIHPLRAASRWAALALAAATIFSSSCQCQPVVTEPLVIRGRSAASPPVTQITGIASYDFTWREEGSLVVGLKDVAGQSKGTLQLSLQESGEGLMEVVTADGHKALRRSRVVVSSGGLWLRERLEAEGEVLLSEQFFNDDHERRTYVLAVQGDASSGAATRSDGFSDEFVAVQEGVEAPEADLQAWVQRWPLQAFGSSPAMLVLLLVPQDEPFLRMLVDKPQPEGTGSMGVLVQGLHRSDACKDIPQVLSLPLGVTCGFCAAALPTLTPPLTVAAVLAVKSCAWCGGLAAYTLAQRIVCWWYAAHAKTEEECKSECRPDENSSVDINSDLCSCECNPEKCEARAMDIVTRGATLCSATCSTVSQRCEIRIKKCGNGRVESAPNCSEVCDPNAVPNGCQPDEDCVGCSQCVKREPPDSGVPDEPDAGVEMPDAGDDQTPDGGDPCNGECWEGTHCENCNGYHCLPNGAQCCSTSGGFCMPGTVCGVCPDGRLTCIYPDGYDTCLRAGDF